MKRRAASRYGLRLALSLVAASSTVAASANAARVAIVFADGFDAGQGVVHDLSLEFRAEGFDIGVIGKELEGESLDDWAERARDDGDGALIHVAPGAAGDAIIEVLLVGPDGLVLKDTIRRQASDASDIASVRAVEVTRAALIHVQEARLPDADIVRDDPYAARGSAGTTSGAASVSPVLAITGQSPLVLLGLGMDLSWLPAQNIALELEGVLPLTQASESAPEGTGHVRATLVDAGASLFFAGKEKWFRPYIAARAGAAIFSMSAASSTFYIGTSQTSASFLGTGAVGASIRLYRFMRLRAEASVGVTATPPVIRINTRDIDHLGLPIALLRIGPEVIW